MLMGATIASILADGGSNGPAPPPQYASHGGSGGKIALYCRRSNVPFFPTRPDLWPIRITALPGALELGPGEALAMVVATSRPRWSHTGNRLDRPHGFPLCAGVAATTQVSGGGTAVIGCGGDPVSLSMLSTMSASSQAMPQVDTTRAPLLAGECEGRW